MDISLSLAALIVTRPLQFVHSRFCSVSMAIKGPTSTFYTMPPTNVRRYVYTTAFCTTSCSPILTRHLKCRCDLGFKSQQGHGKFITWTGRIMCVGSRQKSAGRKLAHLHLNVGWWNITLVRTNYQQQLECGRHVAKLPAAESPPNARRGGGHSSTCVLNYSFCIQRVVRTDLEGNLILFCLSLRVTSLELVCSIARFYL